MRTSESSTIHRAILIGDEINTSSESDFSVLVLTEGRYFTRTSVYIFIRDVYRKKRSSQCVVTSAVFDTRHITGESRLDCRGNISLELAIQLTCNDEIFYWIASHLSPWESEPVKLGVKLKFARIDQ